MLFISVISCVILNRYIVHQITWELFLQAGNELLDRYVNRPLLGQLDIQGKCLFQQAFMKFHVLFLLLDGHKRFVMTIIHNSMVLSVFILKS